MDIAGGTILSHNSDTDFSTSESTENAEAALVRRLRAREPGAFEEVVRLHAGHLMAVARRYLEQDADAEDAVQEALLRAFSCMHQFKGESRLSTWLHRSVVHAALMNRRSRARRRERLFDHDDAVGVAAARSGLEREDPSQRALDTTSHDARLVAEHLRQLPECHRAVVELRLIQHRSTSDAARELGISTSALKAKLHRAKSSIHRSLADDARLADLSLDNAILKEAARPNF